MPRAVTHPALALQNIVKRFGANTAVDGITLDIAAGTFVSFVGPSGCGKSTQMCTHDSGWNPRFSDCGRDQARRSCS
jgi:ABC-type branched-subunit amino acid transport system ATPase component